MIKPGEYRSNFAVVSTWNSPSQKIFPLVQAMSRKTASREPDLTTQMVRPTMMTKKNGVIVSEREVVERAAQHVSNPGWKTASVFLHDVKREGGGHKPEEASKGLSVKGIRAHVVVASPRRGERVDAPVIQHTAPGHSLNSIAGDAIDEKTDL